MELIQGIDSFPSGVVVKFNSSVRVSSIKNANFTLFDNTSTPAITPFEQIDTARDYNSIARAISLYYHTPLVQGDTYRLVCTGLVNAANAVLATDHIDFIPAPTTDPLVIEDLDALVPVPVTIVDKSFKSKAFLDSEKIFVSNVNFYVVDSDPETFDLYVDPSYKSGRITIKFSKAPLPIYLNNDYFKVQYKTIQRLPGRWVDIPVHVSLNSLWPWVYLDLPSNDATPVYGVPGAIYYLSGRKYRVKISQLVGT